MKKNILLSAVISSVLVAGSAYAGSGQVYGNIDAGVDKLSGVEKSADLAVSSNDSYVGFKAQEDVSSNLKVFTKLEYNVAIDGDKMHTDMGKTDGTFLSRNTIVGMKGSFGSVYLGNAKAIMADEQRNFDLFHAHAGSMNTLTGVDAIGRTNKNQITYQSPNMNGVTVAARYVGKEESGVKTDAQGWSANLSYDKNKVGASLTYELAKIDGMKDMSRTLVAGSYDFGKVKTNAFYYHEEFDKSRDVFGLGAGYSLNKAVMLKAQVAHTPKNDISDSATLYSVGADYNYSKNFATYAELATIVNDGKAGYNVASPLTGNAGLTSVAGKDNSAVSVGVKYKF